MQKEVEMKILTDPHTTAPNISPSRKDDNKALKPRIAVIQEEAQDCKSLVHKLNQEKRERERKRQEFMKAEQEKLNKELEERQRKLEEEKSLLQLEKDRKREEIEKKIKERMELRQLSQQRMVEETKKISKKQKLFLEVERKFTDEQVKEADIIRLEKLKEIKDRHQPVSKDEISEHARKYDDIIRQKREELKQKRGVLDSVNSNPNLNIVEQNVSRPPQYQSSERIKNYKSKFYQDLVEEGREKKD